eukprot:2846173-Pleurochrysis_carterae.AAC.1
MRPTAFAFFEQAAASPAAVIDGTLELIVEGLAAGDAAVERLVSAAFSVMAAATRDHAAEFLPGGICAAEQSTPRLRERLSGMPMTSTGAERPFALGRAHDVRAWPSRDDTRAGVILGHADGTAA